MDYNSILEEYNRGDYTLITFIKKISSLSNEEVSHASAYWFCSDIFKRNRVLKPLSVVKTNDTYKFVSNNNELFSIRERDYDQMNSNNSLLRSTVYPCPNDLGKTFEIMNDRFICGKHGLYNIIDEDNYRYICLDDESKIYYEAYVDKKNCNIKKIFFDKYNNIRSKFFYDYKCKVIDGSYSDALNKVNKFVDENYGNYPDKERLIDDLLDQYYYDIKITDKLERYKDNYLVNGSKIIIDKDFDYIDGMSIKGKNNKNKENYLVINNPNNDKLKLMCVTDFVNSSLIKNKLNKYIVMEFENWFLNIDAELLVDDKKLLNSLSHKTMEINSFFDTEIKELTKDKKNINRKKIGSSLGLALVGNDKTYVINYGDTRVYSFKDNNLSPITTDDTTVWDLYKDNRISRDTASDYQKGAVLTNYLGNDKTYFELPKIHTINNTDYDKLFVFGDGVTDNLNDSTISSIIRVNKDEGILKEIITKAYSSQERFDDVSGCCYIRK